MAKKTISYATKKKTVTAILDRRLDEEFNVLLKEFNVSSSTFYSWKAEVKRATEKNRETNKKVTTTKTPEGLSFNFVDMSMEIKNGSITFENAKVTIIDNNVHFTGTGIVYRN